MVRYIQRRLLSIVPIILGVSLLVFSMLHLTPGDPVQLMYAQGQVAVSAEVIEQKREELGLNDPLPVQYLNFVGKALQGNLGRSIRSNRPVLEEILEQVPSTLELTAAGMVIAVMIGLILGVISGWRHGSWIDTGSMVLALLGVSIPNFWLGFLLIMLFCLRLGWLPATGYGGLSRLILPALTLAFGQAAIIARLVRSNMVEVLQEDFIRTARAKGLGERTVLTRHALRASLIPVTTFVGLQFGYLIGGAVVIETVFARQGVGRLAVDAIIYKDFPLVQGCVLYLAFGIVIVNVLIDILYAFVDPRIRFD